MNFLKNNKGSTTIYLVIVFFAVMIFIGLMIDLGRIRVAENQLRRASNAAARSVLADYNTGVKDQYGLFITNPMDETKSKATFKKYLMANLSASPAQDFNLLDYKYEGSDITCFRSIDDPKVLKQQILEEMKYRAPVQLSIEIFQRLKSLGKIFNQMDKADQDAASLNSMKTKLQNMKDKNKTIKKNKEIHHDLSEAIKSDQEELSDLRSIPADERPDDYSDQVARLKNRISKNQTKLKKNEAETKKLADELIQDRKELEKDIAEMEKNSGDTETYAEKDPSASKDDIDQQVDQASDAADKARQAYIDKVEKHINDLLDENLSNSALGKIKNSTGDGFENAIDGIGQLPENVSPTEDNNNDPNNPAQKAELNNIFNEMPPLPNGLNAKGSGDHKSGSAMDQAKKMFNLVNIGNFGIAFRDELYVNEFVLSERNGHLRFENLATSQFKKSDQEYIVCGSAQAALAEVWLIRFALDTPAYYIWVFKPAGPLYGLIASAVAGAIQGAIDIMVMLNPNNTAIKKLYPTLTHVKQERPGSIRLMEVMVPTDPPMPKLPQFDYKDHLRILALMNLGDDKIGRIADKIGENSGVDIHKATTAVYGNTTVSIRLWFLPLAGFKNMDNGPFGTSIRNGRCYITKEVQYAY